MEISRYRGIHRKIVYDLAYYAQNRGTLTFDTQLMHVMHQCMGLGCSQDAY